MIDITKTGKLINNNIIIYDFFQNFIMSYKKYIVYIKILVIIMLLSQYYLKIIYNFLITNK